MVTASHPWVPNPGTWSATRSRSRSRPSSTSIMMLVVVATTLVRDARSNTVSAVIGSDVSAASDRAPKARSYTISPSCPTRTTAPGSRPSRMACSTAASMSDRRTGSTAAEIVDAWQASNRHAAANRRKGLRTTDRGLRITDEGRELPDTIWIILSGPKLNLMPGSLS